MRIRTERTERIVEVYELPDEMRAGTDTDLLAAAEARVPVEGRRVAQSDWVVADRGGDDIEVAAAAYREAKSAVERAETRAKGLLESAVAEGGYSEIQLAAVLGVDRMTVRRWRGKN